MSVMGLLGLVVAGLFNVFLLQCEGLRLIMNLITIPVFIGLTAWETWEIKREAQRTARDGEAGELPTGQPWPAPPGFS